MLFRKKREMKARILKMVNDRLDNITPPSYITWSNAEAGEIYRKLMLKEEKKRNKKHRC